MKIKAIAIGNTLMEDDGVAIVVLEKIKEELIKKNIEVIIGETDFVYSLSLVEDGDFIFFIDAVYYGKKPGEITVISLEKYRGQKKYYTQHDCSIVDLMKLYFKNINGYIIGVEIGKISFKYGLSNVIKSNIDGISNKVLKEITSRI